MTKIVLFVAIFISDSSPISFSAFPSEVSTRYIAGKQLKFNVLTSNTLSAYNPITSTFTCPIRGLYAFNVTIQAKSQGAHAALTMNGEHILHLLIDGGEIETGYVIVDCPARGAVRVEARAESHIENSQRTMFSGFVVHILDVKRAPDYYH